jgi:hypothetical protein
MYTQFAGDFMDCFDSFDRFKGNLDFEIGTVMFTLHFLLVPLTFLSLSAVALSYLSVQFVASIILGKGFMISDRQLLDE